MYENDTIDLSRIPTNSGTESRLGWTKIQRMYENVHPYLALVLLFARTEVECGKGLLRDRPESFSCRSRDFLPRLADKTKSSPVHGGSSDGGKESGVSWSDI